jgi:tetratricopeptide (TPR) repeat protein
MMRFLLILLCFLLLLVSDPSRAQTAPGETVLSFADSLFNEGDYYRAITEYKRFIHLAPQDPSVPRALLAMAEAYFAGRRWQQADAVLHRLVKEHPGTPESVRARLLLGDSALQRGDPALALERYRQALSAPLPGTARCEAHWRSSWSLIEADRFDQALRQLQAVEKDNARALAEKLEQAETLPLKSPGLAGTLSAVLPGAGQLYAGRPREAGMSLALNAAFIAGALESFRNDQHVLGGILLFFEFGWYTGNIYNAVNSVQKHNRDLKQDYKNQLRRDFGLTLGFSSDGTPLPGFRFTF